MDDSNDPLRWDPFDFAEIDFPTMPNENSNDFAKDLADIPNPAIFDTRSNDFDSSAGFGINKTNEQLNKRKHRVSMPIRPLVPLSPPPMTTEQTSPCNPSSKIELEQEVFAPRHSRQKSAPMNTQVLFTDDDSGFNSMCRDPMITYNPSSLGFIPSKYWPNQEFPFGIIVEDFFRRKNNPNTRFSHKLYNALKMVEMDPFFAPILGVEWITERVLKVNARVFGRLLGIKTVKGSLFHSQGNFPSHGFVELSSVEAPKILDPSLLKNVDYEEIRLLVHLSGEFVKGCKESDIENCRWNAKK